MTLAIGFISLITLLLCFLGKIADEWDDMCFVVGYLVRRAWRSIGEWLFDVQTAYYKFRQHRKKVKK